MRGTMRKIGIEGGVWALITDDGRTVELIDPPAGLQKNGLRAEIEGTRDGAEVTIGMVGAALRVTGWKALD